MTQGGGMKKLLLFILAVGLLGIFGSYIYSQVVTPVAVITVEALSPQEIHEMGWTTPPSNGLSVVGRGELVYLSGKNDGADPVTAYAWSLSGLPPGSAATLDSTDKAWTTFRPDTTGEFDVTLQVMTAGGMDDTTITIVSAFYVGVGGMDGLGVDVVAGQCAFCHATNKAGWEATKHASKLSRAIDGIDHTFYAQDCIQCHSVGYDTTAVNGGFDDIQAQLGWEFPDTLQAGNWEDMKTNFTPLAHKANIQCENCHGPGSLHKGDKTKIQISIDEGLCGKCHEEEPYHLKNIQWKESRHAQGESFSRGTSSSCAPCHSGWGFIATVDPASDLDLKVGAVPVSCPVCHDPHSVDNPRQLRKVDDVTLENGEVISFGGRGRFCMNCHHSRRNADTYVQEYSSHFGPHHSGQSDMLAGTNAVSFGMHIPISNHRDYVPDACVTCHMSPSPADGEPGHNLLGEHTWSMHYDGGTPEDPSDDVDNVSACITCHGPITSFDDLPAKMDYDNDGTVENAQSEIAGLLDELGKQLPPIGDPAVEVTEEYTPNQLRAAYNHAFVADDGSHGVHNYQYAVNLLRVAFAAVTTGDIGAGMIQEIADVPNDQGRNVRIVWGRFGGDGVGNLPIQFYSLWRRVDENSNEAMAKTASAYESVDEIAENLTKMDVGARVAMTDGLWDFAGTVPAGGLETYSTIAPTLYDSTASNGMRWSVFKVSGHTDVPAVYAESAPDSGYSVDNLVPSTPMNVQALETSGGVALDWDDPVDDDFKYFSVYRSTSSGFDPESMEPIGTSTEPSYTDATVMIGNTYYYRLSTSDFSGNESTFSGEISLVVTSVKASDLTVIPDDFVLTQNYPNPFNPSTEISFGVPREEFVRVVVYNVLGKHVRTLAEGTFAPGHYKLIWEANDDLGNKVGPGLYLYRLESASFRMTKKMMMIK